MSEAKYIVLEETNKHILIKDVGPWDQHLSVTNGAEGVVDKLASRLMGRRLFYIDSEGDKTELKIKNGQFDDFGWEWE